MTLDGLNVDSKVLHVNYQQLPCSSSVSQVTLLTPKMYFMH